MQQGTLNIKDSSQQELIAALKANNEVVMKELYTTNYPKVKAFVLQNCGSASEAKDIFQDAFVALWSNVPNDKFTPQNDTSLSGYLYRIAKNKWIDYLRSAHHNKSVPESHLRAVPLYNDEEDDELVWQEKESLKKIMTAFDRLGEKCKTVLQQFYFKRRSYREIAGDTDMQEASVRNQKYRCMQKLRKLVQKSN